MRAVCPRSGHDGVLIIFLFRLFGAGQCWGCVYPWCVDIVCSTQMQEVIALIPASAYVVSWLSLIYMCGWLDDCLGLFACQVAHIVVLICGVFMSVLKSIFLCCRVSQNLHSIRLISQAFYYFFCALMACCKYLKKNNSA